VVIKRKGVYSEKGEKGNWVEYDEAGMIIKKQNIN
jgi:hypothetical protein